MDVETAEGWPTSAAFQPVNAAIIQGALAAIRQAGDIGGIYCTWYQWGEITGSYIPPGADAAMGRRRRSSLSDGYYSAQSYCQRALSPGDPSTAQVGADRLRRRRALARAVRLRDFAPTRIDVDYSCG